MTEKQRNHYFAKYWPQACAVQGWEPKDDVKRHQVTRQCMLLIGGPDTDSTTLLGQAEISALFTYLWHLADPQNLRLNAAWEACQRDYRTRNRAAQGDYWRRKAGYKKSGRVNRERFDGRANSGRFGESQLSANESEDYLVTMRNRAKAKQRREAAAAARRSTKYDLFHEAETDDKDIPF